MINVNWKSIFLSHLISCWPPSTGFVTLAREWTQDMQQTAGWKGKKSLTGAQNFCLQTFWIKIVERASERANCHLHVRKSLKQTEISTRVFLLLGAALTFLPSSSHTMISNIGRTGKSLCMGDGAIHIYTIFSICILAASAQNGDALSALCLRQTEGGEERGQAYEYLPPVETKERGH